MRPVCNSSSRGNREKIQGNYFIFHSEGVYVWWYSKDVKGAESLILARVPSNLKLGVHANT